MDINNLTTEQIEYIHDNYRKIRPELVEWSLYEKYDYVDMGEAGIWAKYPIGITEWNEDWESNIKYFAWGETEGYTKNQIGIDKQFDWSNYKWCNGNSNEITKYNNNPEYGEVDNLTTLLPEDDACTVNMGGNWRIPTIEEFQKLYNLCDTEWINNYNGVSGLVGVIFKLKTDESKQLFFPLSGFCNIGSVEGWTTGYFLSSSLDFSNSKYVFHLFFFYNTVDMDGSYRCNGYPILGILDTK